MKQKFIAILMALLLAATLAACGGGEETTLTGMVVSVDGTVISLMEMDSNNMDGRKFAEGERPEMPEGMDGFGDFDPGAFDGTLPEGETFPQWRDGEIREMPEGMAPPEGMTMPDFNDENGGMRPGFGNFGEDMETKDVDIGDAHISVEVENSKESGSLENIVPGAFVTITMDGKGKVTYVLVSSQSVFGGNGRRPMN